MRWGGGGGGSWVRIYANHEHVFAVIAGLRWDTSYSEDGDRTGPGWSEEMRPTGGFRLRHPLGLARRRPRSPGAATADNAAPGNAVRRYKGAAWRPAIRLFWLFNKGVRPETRSRPDTGRAPSEELAKR